MPPKRNYDRKSIRFLESLKEELIETYIQREDRYKYTRIAMKYNIEPGILMIMMSGLWEDFKVSYKRNTKSGLYRKFLPYTDSE